MIINYDKNTGLVPTIIQDADTNMVLMLGYMNQEALEKTLTDNRITFLVEAGKDFGPRVK